MVENFSFFMSKVHNLEELLEKDIEEYKTIDLIKEISSFNPEDRKNALAKEKIKNKLKKGILKDAKATGDYYGYFRSVMSYLTPSEVLSLYDSSEIKNFFNGNIRGYEYIFFVCLCEKNINETVRYVLKDDGMFHEFFKDNHYFYSIFYELDYKLLKEVVFKMENSSKTYRYDFIFSCSIENQKKLLSENLNKDTIYKLLSKLNIEVLNEFFQNDKRAIEYIPYINIISYAESGVVFSDKIVDRIDFFERLKSSSFVTFRQNINIIEKNNNPLIIEKRVKRYYEELLSSYNPKTGLFSDYEVIVNNPRIKFRNKDDFILSNDLILDIHEMLRKNYDSKEQILEYLKRTTSKKITEIVVDALFQDNYYNVCLNIKEMLRFNESLDDKEKILDDEKVKFYNTILDFDYISSDIKIELYNSLKDKNLNYIFYDDLRKLKDASYNRIKNNIFKVKKHSDYLNIDISKEHNVDVYDLRDKEYFLFVRSMTRYHPDSIYERHCYSLISNENNDVFDYDYGYKFLYGFDTFDNDTVLHVLESDAFSSSIKDKSSAFVNRIMSPREIVNSDSMYSEIQLANRKSKTNERKYESIKPSYIVCFDIINEDVVEEAKRLRIPIILINKKRLLEENKTDIVLDRNNDVYVSDYITENAKKSSR